MKTDDPLDWLFGDTFALRLDYEQANRHVLWSRLVRNLQTDRVLADRWREWILSYRALLINPQDAPIKLQSDLRIAVYDFSAQILDVFAEVLAVLNLASLGASAFQVWLPVADVKTPDFTCILGGKRTAIEVKNLRVHRFAENVMLNHYYDIALKRDIKPPLTLVLHRSTRESLGRDEHCEAELREVVERLIDFRPDVDHEIELLSGAIVRFRLEKGGHPRAVETSRHDADVDIVSREIRTKILRVAKEALPQLFSDRVGSAERRVIAMRWELPWYDIQRPEGVSEVLQTDFETLWADCGCRAEVLIFTDFSIELNTLAS